MVEISTTPHWPLASDIKAQWLEALRSGNYVQGTGNLAFKDDKGVMCHCCLGVLCEILKIKKDEAAVQPEPRHERVLYEYKVDYEGDWNFLPYAVADRAFNASTPTNDPRFDLEWTPILNDPYGNDEGRQAFSLSSLNDAGFTFDQIADVINYMW